MKRSLILLMTIGAVLAAGQLSAMDGKGKRRPRRRRVRIERGPARRSLSSHTRGAAAGRGLRYAQCKVKLNVRQHKLARDEKKFRQALAMSECEEQAIKRFDQRIKGWDVRPIIYTPEDLRWLEAQDPRVAELELERIVLTERQIAQNIEATRLLRERVNLAVAGCEVLRVRDLVLSIARAKLERARTMLEAEDSDC